jgi:hypothetical protein
MSEELKRLLASYGVGDSGRYNPFGDPFAEYSKPGGAGNAISSVGSTASYAPFPEVQAAGMGLDAAGKIYGAFEDQQAQETADREKRNQQVYDRTRQGRSDMMNEENNRRSGLMENASYADKQLEELLRNYGPYNSRIGR